MEDDVEASEAKEEVRGGGGASGDNDDGNGGRSTSKKADSMPQTQPLMDWGLAMNMLDLQRNQQDS